MLHTLSNLSGPTYEANFPSLISSPKEGSLAKRPNLCLLQVG